MPDLSVELLLAVGPALLFLMAMAETSVPLGLLVPAGVALALGAFLANQGLLSFPVVLVAAGTGGLVGDSMGYWMGRRGFARLLDGGHLLNRAVRRYERLTRRLQRRSPVWSVSLARTVSFVRTLMPPTAGMSGLSYPRFLLFDLPGVLAWLALYTGVGILAGESWRVASGVVGTGWALLLGLGALIVWLVARFRRLRAEVQGGGV